MTRQASVYPLLVRAAVAQHLAACFRPPRAGTAAALGDGLAAVVTSSAPSYAEVAPAVSSLADTLASLDDEALQAEYSRLFIGTAATPLHETAYGPPRLTTAAELADIQGFYRAFGFELSEATPDMADHLGAELEFHAALLVKLAWASSEGLREPQEVTAGAVAAFLDAHLGRWTATLADWLAAAGGVYAQAAAAVAAFVRDECLRFDVAPLPLAIREARGEAETFTCPHAETCH
jgi:putative dimethyl sulfoxide reductase chaperone